jgi:hypothetical protein
MYQRLFLYDLKPDIPLQQVDKKLQPKKFKISFFSIVRANLQLAAILTL